MNGEVKQVLVSTGSSIFFGSGQRVVDRWKKTLDSLILWFLVVSWFEQEGHLPQDHQEWASSWDLDEE